MELEMTFPASDPPASTQPGSGVTGPVHRRARPSLAPMPETGAHRRLKLDDE